MYILRSCSIHFARSVYYYTFLLFKYASTFEIQLPRGEGIDIFERFNTATFMSMLLRRRWIFCVQWFEVRDDFSFFILAGFLTRLTQRVSLVEQELFTLPEHLSSPPVFSGVRFGRSFVFCVLLDRCLSVFLFVLVIVFSVFLRFQIPITPLASPNFS